MLNMKCRSQQGTDLVEGVMTMNAGLYNFLWKETMVSDAHELGIQIERIKPSQEPMMRHADNKCSSRFQDTENFAHSCCFIGYMFKNIQTENSIEAGGGER